MTWNQHQVTNSPSYDFEQNNELKIGYQNMGTLKVYQEYEHISTVNWNSF